MERPTNARAYDTLGKPALALASRILTLRTDAERLADADSLIRYATLRGAATLEDVRNALSHFQLAELRTWSKSSAELRTWSKSSAERSAADKCKRGALLLDAYRASGSLGADVSEEPATVRRVLDAQADAEPAQADAEPAQADAEPAQADAEPAQADAEPAQADAEPAGVLVLTLPFKVRKPAPASIPGGLRGRMTRPERREDSGARLAPGYVRLDLEDGRTFYTDERNLRTVEDLRERLQYAREALERYQREGAGFGPEESAEARIREAREDLERLAQAEAAPDLERSPEARAARLEDLRTRAEYGALEPGEREELERLQLPADLRDEDARERLERALALDSLGVPVAPNVRPLALDFGLLLRLVLQYGTLPAIVRLEGAAGARGRLALALLERAGFLVPQVRGDGRAGFLALALPREGMDALQLPADEDLPQFPSAADLGALAVRELERIGLLERDARRSAEELDEERARFRAAQEEEEREREEALDEEARAQAREARERREREARERRPVLERFRERLEREALAAEGFRFLQDADGIGGRYVPGDMSHADACKRARGLRVEVLDITADAGELDPYADAGELMDIREEAQAELIQDAEDEGREHGTVRTVRTVEGCIFVALDTYNPPPQSDAARARERGESAGLDVDSVLEGFARTAWADAYGNALESLALDPGTDTAEPASARAERAQWRAPSMAGAILEDLAPRRIRGDFRAQARVIVREVLLHAPEETLRAWADFGDADRIGTLLYMDSSGHGCGLADEDLPRVEDSLQVSGLPYSGGRPCAFRNLDAHGFPGLEWEELPDAGGDFALPLAEDILASGACATPAGKRSAEGAARACAGLLRAWRAGVLDAEEVLQHADRILGGFGIEELDLPAPDEDESGGTVRYVNRGDTYTGTLMYVEDASGDRFLAGDWGSVLEGAESERTECTGETRCPNCGAWGMGGLDSGLAYASPEARAAEECGDCGYSEE